MRNLLKLITWPLRIVLFLLLAILASLNLHQSTVNLFLGSQWRTPMAVLLLIAFVCGAIVGVMAVTIRRFKLSARKPQAQAIDQTAPSLDSAKPVNSTSNNKITLQS
jgi:lipopolysaccharide assembly protein A